MTGDDEHSGDDSEEPLADLARMVGADERSTEDPSDGEPGAGAGEDPGTRPLGERTPASHPTGSNATENAAVGSDADEPSREARSSGTEPTTDPTASVSDADEDPGREGPLGDIADRIERRRERRTEGSDVAELFEEVEVGTVDREALWEQIEGEPAAVVDDPGRRVERVIDKQAYCHRCPYFSPPPEVHCTHDGTTILELVDVDWFRVVDCPVVRADEDLERIENDGASVE